MGQFQIRLGGHIDPALTIGLKGFFRSCQRQFHVQYFQNLGPGQYQAHMILLEVLVNIIANLSLR